MSWKEFLEKNSGVGDWQVFENRQVVLVSEVREFALGEVARLEKELKRIRPSKGISYNEINALRLEGKIEVWKEIAGEKE